MSRVKGFFLAVTLQLIVVSLPGLGRIAGSRLPIYFLDLPAPRRSRRSLTAQQGVEPSPRGLGLTFYQTVTLKLTEVSYPGLDRQPKPPIRLD